MELHVTGRHLTLKDDFREHAEERLARLDHLLSGDRRADVVVTKGGDGGITVELTLLGKAPVIRAEAGNDDKFVAFDQAFAKLSDRVKRANERRRSGRRQVVPALAPAAMAPLESVPAARDIDEPATDTEPQDDGPDVVELPDTPIEVRVKRHQATPMSLEQAIYEMEMVGHDFYLFTDADSGLPSVMYRRRGWSYGVLHLEPARESAGEAARDAS